MSIYNWAYSLMASLIIWIYCVVDLPYLAVKNTTVDDIQINRTILVQRGNFPTNVLDSTADLFFIEACWYLVVLVWEEQKGSCWLLTGHGNRISLFWVREQSKIGCSSLFHAFHVYFFFYQTSGLYASLYSIYDPANMLLWTAYVPFLWFHTKNIKKMYSKKKYRSDHVYQNKRYEAFQNKDLYTNY